MGENPDCLGEYLLVNPARCKWLGMLAGFIHCRCRLMVIEDLSWILVRASPDSRLDLMHRVQLHVLTAPDEEGATMRI